MKKSVLFSLLLLSTSALTASQSNVFTFQDNGSVSVSLSGTTKTGLAWVAEDVKEGHIPFQQILFGDADTMSGFAGGSVRSPESVDVRVKTQWLPRFRSGQPHGGLTVFLKDSTSSLPIGHVVAGGGDRDDVYGVSEVAYSFLPNTAGPKKDGYGGFYDLNHQNVTLWGQGFGSSIVEKIVTVWAPEVSRIGHGKGMDEVQEMPIIQNFQCFNGKPLGRLDATASPKNPGSWKILDRYFSSARARLDSHTVIDWDQKDFSSFGEMEEAFLKLYEVTARDGPLTPGVRYKFIDPDGKPRTVSKHPDYQCLKYHFEHLVQS